MIDPRKRAENSDSMVMRIKEEMTFTKKDHKDIEREILQTAEGNNIVVDGPGPSVKDINDSLKQWGAN